MGGFTKTLLNIVGFTVGVKLTRKAAALLENALDAHKGNQLQLILKKEKPSKKRVA
jgi:hypothetical protein